MSELITCQGCGEQVPHYAIYGDIGEALCADCYYARQTKECGYEEWYGMAPHHHDLSITGHIVGSTVLDPLPDTQDEHGWYKIADGLFFWPDPEVDGAQGIWRRYANTSAAPDAAYPVVLPGMEE